MNPSLDISGIETDLRFVIRQHRPQTDEETWLRSVLGDVAVDDLLVRRSAERSRRRPARVPDELLVYTTLVELRKCLDSISWTLVASSLGKKKEFDVLLDQVDRYRNTIAHSRELLPHEADFLHGVAGLIRTRITIHRSTMDVDSQHYPVIESIKDSFGNEATRLDPTSAMVFEVTGIHLQVGDIVKFSCRGWDAQGRELTWDLGHFAGPTLSSQKGTDVVLQWTVSESDVGIGCQIGIGLNSSGKYHRHGSVDQRVLFVYSVDPPNEA